MHHDFEKARRLARRDHLKENYMAKILMGLAVFVALSFVVGIATHWAVGAAVAAIPVAVVYTRLKLSPKYRVDCDQKLSTITTQKT